GTTLNSLAGDTALYVVLDTCFKDLPNLILIGDFNFPGIKWERNAYVGTNFTENEFISILNNNNVTQLINEHTRYRNLQKPNILDLLLVTDPNLISKVEVGGPVGISDHCSIIV